MNTDLVPPSPIQVANCKECPLSVGGRASRPVPGDGNDQDPKFLIIGEGPGHNEVNQGKPFVGASGKMISRALASCGVKREDIWITNVTMCLPGQGTTDAQKRQAAKCCAPRLYAEIGRFGDRPALVLGAVAAQSILGTSLSISNLAGTYATVDLPTGQRLEVIPSIHPAAILRGMGTKTKGSSAGAGNHAMDLMYWNLLYDLGKVKDLSLGKKIQFSEDIITTTKDSDVDLVDRLLVALERAFRVGRPDNLVLAVDLETTPMGQGQEDLQITYYGLATQHLGISFPAKLLSKRGRKILKGILGDESIPKVMHNRLFDKPVLADHYLPVAGMVHDTMLMHHAAFPGGAHDLQRVAGQFFAIRPWKAEFRSDGSSDLSVEERDRLRKDRDKIKRRLKSKKFYLKFFLIVGMVMEKVLAEERKRREEAIYNALDALATARLYAPLSSCVKATGTQEVYELDIEMAKIAERMTKVGVPVDLVQNRELAAKFDEDLASAEADIRKRQAEVEEDFFEFLSMEMAKVRRKGEPDDYVARCEIRLKELKAKRDKLAKKGERFFSVNSSFHVVAFLAACGARLYKTTTKGRLSTKKDVVESLAGQIPEADKIIDYREAGKLRSTFVDNFYENLRPDGRVHPKWKVHMITGRWSSESPQVQNFPKENAAGRPNLRKQVVAPPGRVFVGADFAQLEARIIGLLSGDPFLLDIFSHPEEKFGPGDIHYRFAKEVWPTIDALPDKEKKELRDIVKSPEYCLVPETRLLCEDLSWRAIGDIKVGDRLIGFLAPEPGEPWKDAYFELSTVEESKVLQKQCYRIVTDRGEVTASYDHLWVGRRSGRKGWLRTEDLHPGDYLIFTKEPWAHEDSYESGYLAGILDGEGWVSGEVGFGQNPGPVLDRCKELLSRRDFMFSEYAHNVTADTVNIEIRGGIWEHMRILGTLRPTRLIDKREILWRERRLRGKGVGAEVLDVEPIGQREVVGIQTSTRTFVAEGFLSHNCTFYRGDPSTAYEAVVKRYPNVRREDVYRMVEIMKKSTPGVQKWHESLMEQVMRKGVLRAVGGRMRVFPLGQGEVSDIVNFPVQSTGAHLMNTGLKDFVDAMPKGPSRVTGSRILGHREVEPILQVHDFLGVECDEDIAEDIAKLMRRTLSRSLTHNGITVHFPAEPDIGKCWTDI